MNWRLRRVKKMLKEPKHYRTRYGYVKRSSVKRVGLFCIIGVGLLAMALV